MGNVLNDEFFSRLETLALSLRPNLGGFFGGTHRTKTYGQTVEFSDYREYMLGDDIRRIDWNLYSRFEKYFLKLFTDERQMHVQIILDCSASMGKTNPNKSDYAVNIAAALGFLSVHNMDKVSFKALKNNVAEDIAGIIVGKNAFFRAVTQLESLKFEGSSDMGEAIINCPNTGNNDGLTVIISDFFSEDDWKRAVDFLTFKKRQVMLVQVFAPEEIDPAYMGRMNFIDSESDDVADDRNMKLKVDGGMQKAYRMAIRDFKLGIKKFCRSRDADYVSVRCDRPLEKTLFNDLLKTGMMV